MSLPEGILILQVPSKMKKKTQTKQCSKTFITKKNKEDKLARK